MSEKIKCNNGQVLILKANTFFYKQDEWQNIVEKIIYDIKHKGVVVIPSGIDYCIADLAGVIEKNEG